MNKKKICIDLDDTIWEHCSQFFDFYFKKTGKVFKKKDQKTYSFKDTLKISHDEEISLLKEFDDLFFKPVLFKDVLESLLFLEKNHEIHFVTARHENLKERTTNFLKEFFDFEFYVFFTCNKYHKEIKSKTEYCLENGIKLIIEDKLETVEDCAIKGIKCILIDSPWNQKKILHKNIIRVKNWKEILEILKNEN